MVNQKQACKLLGIGRSKFLKLEATDKKFPKKLENKTKANRAFLYDEKEIMAYKKKYPNYADIHVGESAKKAPDYSLLKLNELKIKFITSPMSKQQHKNDFSKLMPKDWVPYTDKAESVYLCGMSALY